MGERRTADEIQGLWRDADREGRVFLACRKGAVP
jgi:hypothetical protein